LSWPTEVAELVPDALELGDLLVRVLADGCHLLLGGILDLLLLVGLGALGLQGRELLLELRQALATRASRRSPRFLISRRRFASWVGRSRWRASSSTEITMYAAK
jgi:hypothetical protein